MLKGKNLVRDLICLGLLIGLIQYNFKQQYVKHMSTKTMAKHVAKKSFEKITDTVSDTLTKLGEVTRRKDRNKKKPSKKVSSFVSQTDALLGQLERTQAAIEKDELLDKATQEKLIRKVKALHSQAEHLRKEALKDPEQARFMHGPAANTAKIVYERSLNKKLLDTVSQTESLLCELAEEQGSNTEKVTVDSVEQGLAFNQTLLS